VRRAVFWRGMQIFKHALAFFSIFAAACAAAQDYPAKPVRILVAFPPGSATDVVTRIAAEKLSQAFGQPVVVENRPGAGGNVGAQAVAKAEPDGYSLLTTSVAFAVNVSLYAKPGYAANEFVPVARLGGTPNLLFVHPSVPAKDLKELLDLARRQPLAYASSGNGTTTHLAIEVLKRLAGVEIQHVPFTPAAAANAVLGNQVPVGSTSMPPTVGHVKAGRLRPIGVTSARRSATLPDVPTIAEQGFPGFEDSTWFAAFAPAGTPAAIVVKLNAEMNRALDAPDTRERYAALGLEFSRNTAPEFAEQLQREIAKYAKAVRESGARAD
jgi:tripartite-type tricarboxylate transporter receptor subunit TctC